MSLIESNFVDSNFKNDFSATHLLSMSRLGVFTECHRHSFFTHQNKIKNCTRVGAMTPVNSQSFFKMFVLRGSHILHTFWTIKTIEKPVQIQPRTKQ